MNIMNQFEAIESAVKQSRTIGKDFHVKQDGDKFIVTTEDMGRSIGYASCGQWHNSIE